MTALKTPQPARHPDPTARVTELTHLVFERPDLDRAETFLSDFGFSTASRTDETLYMRSTAPSPYCYRIHRGPTARFVGPGFLVSSRQELDSLERIDGAGSIAPSEHPGGGEVLHLTDPSGFSIEVLHGRSEAEAIPTRAPLSFNAGASCNRVNTGQRPPVAPPAVIRLGHLALEAVDYQATAAWYTQHLGFIPSDVQVLPDGSPVVTFLRMDRGDIPTDHHTVALVQGFIPQYNHSAYEVVDADAVGMGQRVLRERGYKHAWGIGRHILGSQIFDYWEDSWGDKHEHYCDGDLFTHDVPMGVIPASREAMAQWGDPMPSSFTRPRLSPAVVRAAFKNIRRSPDLSMRKALAMARLFG